MHKPQLLVVFLLKIKIKKRSTHIHTLTHTHNKSTKFKHETQILVEYKQNHFSLNSPTCREIAIHNITVVYEIYTRNSQLRLNNQNTRKNKPKQSQKKKLQHGQNRPTKKEPTKVPVERKSILYLCWFNETPYSSENE